MKLNNDEALISTAVLTAIWDEKHEDNIDLIKPFVMSIICEAYSINCKIDELYIIKQLKNKYCFNDFPLAILKIILKRLKRDNILTLNNKSYYLKQNRIENIELFNSRRESVELEISKTINDLSQYLTNQMGKDIDNLYAEKLLIDFISSYGYNTYNNINTTKSINPKIEHTNYLIGEYICLEESKKSNNFDIILKIIEGHLIANTIYLQIDSNSNISLKKLNCFLDSSFLLCVLGLKTDEENKSANELYCLLKKYGAQILCFTHTFNEVYNIIDYYKCNIKKSKENTLEYFDSQNYSEGQVDAYLASLDSVFNQYGIKIVDKPDFDNNSKYCIDCDSLYNALKEHKISNNLYYKESSIANDVDSVNSINVLRKGVKFNKIENCNYIFVTSYFYLKKASKDITNEDNSCIGLVLDNLDLTAILWLKNNNSNNDLPRMRLIENALAATKASDAIIRKAIPIFEQFKKDNPNLNISDCMTKYYLNASGFNKTIKNDIELVSKEMFNDFINDKDKLISSISYQLENTKREQHDEKMKLEEKNKTLEKENTKLKNSYDNLIKSIEKDVDIKYQFIKKTIKKFCYLLLVMLLFYIIVSILKSYSTNSKSIFDLPLYIYLLIIVEILGVFDMFIGKTRIIINYLYRVIENCERNEKYKKTKGVLDKIDIN